MQIYNFFVLLMIVCFGDGQWRGQYCEEWENLQ